MEKTADRKSFQIAIVVLVAAIAFLGFRAQGAVSGLFKGRAEFPSLTKTPNAGNSGTTGAAGTGATSSTAGAVTAKDSLLDLTPSVLARDPFRPPSVVSTEPARKPRTEKPPVPQEVVPPTLRALLFEGANSTVQLGVGNASSDWIREGGEFHGWRVVRIQRGEVKVEKDGRTFTITASNGGER